MVIYSEAGDWGPVMFIFVLLTIALKKEKKMPRLLLASRRLKIKKKQF